MSQDNVEMICRSLAAYNRRDFDMALNDLDEDVTLEFGAAAGGALDPVYQGHSGVRAFWSDVAEHFEEVKMEPSDFQEAGDAVFHRVQFTGRGKLSGIPMEVTFYAVSDVRAGRSIRVRFFPERKDALEAVGLSE